MKAGEEGETQVCELQTAKPATHIQAAAWCGGQRGPWGGWVLELPASWFLHVSFQGGLELADLAKSVGQQIPESTGVTGVPCFAFYVGSEHGGPLLTYA